MPDRGATARLSQPTDPQDAIRVMVVDDALVIRGMLSRMIEEESGMSVIASVGDGERALKSLERHEVDVVVLDIEMPRMDGITFLKKLMAERPTPVVICSTLTERGAEVTMQAMASGAVDIITKPKSGLKGFLQDSKTELVSAIRGAAVARMSSRSRACLRSIVL